MMMLAALTGLALQADDAPIALGGLRPRRSPTMYALTEACPNHVVSASIHQIDYVARAGLATVQNRSGEARLLSLDPVLARFSYVASVGVACDESSAALHIYGTDLEGGVAYICVLRFDRELNTWEDCGFDGRESP